MYCIYCGNQVYDTASVCPKCGKKIRKNVVDQSDEHVAAVIPKKNTIRIRKNQKDIAVNKRENDVRKDKNDHIRETEIDYKSIAKKYFSEDEFGDRTHLFQETDQEYLVQFIVKNYTLIDDEEPLFAFGYKENFEQGFLITNKRIIWKNMGWSGAWKFEDIGVIDDVKYSSVVDALMLFDRKVVKFSSYILLTHIKDPYLFVFRFAMFLLEICPSFGVDDKLTTILKYVSYSIGKVKTFGVRWKSINRPRYCSELSDTQKEYFADLEKKIKNSLQIDMDETLFCGNKTNMDGSHVYAITNKGIYYKNSNNVVYLTWSEFESCKIKILDKHNLAIGNSSLVVEDSINEHMNLLINLQNSINWFWDDVFSVASTKEKKAEKVGFILESVPKEIAEKFNKETEGKPGGSDQIKFNNGYNLSIDKQVVSMKEALNIDSEKRVYLLVPTGIVGNYGYKSKGFAIVEDGFYYRNDFGEVGILTWNKYCECKVYSDIFIFVDNNGFNVGGLFNQPVLDFLCGLKTYIKHSINPDSTPDSEKIHSEPSSNDVVVNSEKTQKEDEDGIDEGLYQASCIDNVNVANDVDNEDIVICPNCGNKIKKDTKFCKYCGQQQTISIDDTEKVVVAKEPENEDLFATCIYCGKTIQKKKNFCQYCGKPIANKEMSDASGVNKFENSDEQYVYCKRCGHKIKKGKRFCSQCGLKIQY